MRLAFFACYQMANVFCKAQKGDISVLTRVLQVEKALNGQTALFALRVTKLGDGTSVIAASWLHLLGDGRLSYRFIKQG